MKKLEEEKKKLKEKDWDEVDWDEDMEQIRTLILVFNFFKRKSRLITTNTQTISLFFIYVI